MEYQRSNVITMIFQQNSEIQYLHVKQQVVFCAEGHPCLQIMNLKEAMLFHWKKYYLKAAMFYLIGCLDPEINRQYIFYQIKFDIHHMGSLISLNFLS